MVDTDDMKSCEKCGVYFDKKKVMIKDNDDKYSNNMGYICPVCKKVNWEYY
jgi:hypothetical protein